MKTPYVPHLFGEDALAKLKSRQGWLTAGIASSIPWPQEDVWLLYDGHEYVLRGMKAGDEKRSPCISTPSTRPDFDAASTRVYKFASVLGWFKGGYVDVMGMVWGSMPILYGTREAFTTTLQGGKYFSCNYMPVITDDQTRKALAFLREGRRLQHVHAPYSFLSFFKVVESQFESKDRVAWFNANLPQLDGDAAKRIAELQGQGIDVGKHLFDSGRSAVAHASIGKVIVDPDIPEDRRRINEDLDVMAALATRFIQVDAGVPDEGELYENRDRITPWHGLFSPDVLQRLKNREEVDDPAAWATLEQTKVSVRLWPHQAPEVLRDMTLAMTGYGPGLLLFVLHNGRGTVFLAFALDLGEGRLHTQLEDSGLTEQFSKLEEGDVEHFTRYFHSAVGNALVELCVEGLDPVPCEIVIPLNIIPQAPEKMVTQELERFRKSKGLEASAQEADSLSSLQAPT